MILDLNQLVKSVEKNISNQVKTMNNKLEHVTDEVTKSAKRYQIFSDLTKKHVAIRVILA